MPDFQAFVNENGEFVLKFDPTVRQALVDKYAIAKGYVKTLSRVVEGQEDIPASFRRSEDYANPQTSDEFICRLIEQSIANVILLPEIEKAKAEAAKEVIDSFKDKLPL